MNTINWADYCTDGLPEFHSVAPKDWQDWKWQKRNAVMVYPKTPPQEREEARQTLIRWFDGDDIVAQLTPELMSRWAVNITPYLANQLARLKQIGKNNWREQMLRAFIPAEHQSYPSRPFEHEGMGTDERRRGAYQGLPRCMSRLYDNRVIVKISTMCPVACQFCFRSHAEAEHHELEASLREDIANAVQYVEEWNRWHVDEQHITDVILSGGDPLSLSDERICRILRAFKRTLGVELLRIDTKFPAVLPQRITPEFVEALKEFHPLVMDIHFTHPGELCPEVKEACERLADAGIMLGSHTPLMRGITDDREVLTTLFWNLLRVRVRPLYLINSIYTPGTEHLAVPVERGLELIKYLERDLPGPAQPHFILYTTGGGGKVHLQPPYLKERRQDGWIVDTWKGEEFYPDPS